MKTAASFAAGFATGWVVRSTVDSSHEAVVRLVALCYDAIERGRRIVALERERVDDLVAEARARGRARAGMNVDDAAPRSHDGSGAGSHEQSA